VGEKCSDKFRLRIRLPRNSRDLLHAANLRHGTDGFTSPPKEDVLKIFFALKNPTASAGFEPANLGTKGQHATSRPPKPILAHYVFEFPLLNQHWLSNYFAILLPCTPKVSVSILLNVSFNSYMLSRWNQR